MAMIGEIKLWGNPYYPPKGWRFCDGSKIDAHGGGYALSYIIGDTYGWEFSGGYGDKVDLPNIEPVKDKDGRGTSRYIICVHGEYPEFDIENKFQGQ